MAGSTVPSSVQLSLYSSFRHGLRMISLFQNSDKYTWISAVLDNAFLHKKLRGRSPKICMRRMMKIFIPALILYICGSLRNQNIRTGRTFESPRRAVVHALWKRRNLWLQK